MILHTGVRQVLAALAALLLLGLTFQGIVGGADQWKDSTAIGQYAQSVAQVGYGLCALFSLVTVVRWREFAVHAQAGLVVSSALAAGLSNVFWGAGSLWNGLLAGVGALLISAALVWLVRAAIVPLAQKEL